MAALARLVEVLDTAVYTAEQQEQSLLAVASGLHNAFGTHVDANVLRGAASGLRHVALNGPKSVADKVVAMQVCCGAWD